MKNVPTIWNKKINKLAHMIFISLALELKDEIQFEIREKGTNSPSSLPLSILPSQPQLIYIQLVHIESRSSALSHGLSSFP